MNFDKELDVRGLNCPMPIMKAKIAIADLTPGNVLKVIGTDPNSKNEFQIYAKQSGNELITISERGGEFSYFLRKQ
jgi:tRNA 2-thiouridine synthesizing protein A